MEVAGLGGDGGGLRLDLRCVEHSQDSWTPLSKTCHSDRYGSSGPYSSPDYTELDMNYMYLDFKSPEFPPAAGYATYDADLGAKYPICQMPYI